MSDLTGFLLARIAEDEQVARDAAGGPDARYSWASVDYYAPSNEAHGRRWEPARVLAECQAKRAIIDWRRAFAAVSEDPGTELATRLTSGGAVDGLDAAIKAHAAVYSDHPDYQPEWKS